MSDIINIHDSGKIITLSVGIYKVKVLGGWGITIGDFSFTLTNLITGNTIKPKGIFWRIQNNESNLRSKKIFSLDILESAEYKIEFQNQKSLEVSRSNLFLFQILEKDIPNMNIQICIE